MDDISSKLKRCGALTDTIRVAELFLSSSVVFMLVFPPLLVAIVGMLTKTAELSASMLGWMLAGSAFGVLLSLPPIRSLFLVLREGKPQQVCLFLRAFRADATSDQLRAWLKASLGGDYKLTGIRPPNERASPLLTFLSPLITGLRYAGSRQFELEAPDRNWMARLLATFGEARLVFMDVRDVTPHVLDEVHLAWKVFGPDRVIFIIDDRKSPAEWTDWIVAQVGADQNDPLKLLSWPASGAPPPPEFVARVQDLLKGVPEGTPTVSDSALAFVEGRVKPEDWPIRPLERPWAFAICSMFVTAMLLLVLRAAIPPFAYDLLACVFMLLFQGVFWTAWNRARKQRKFAIQINHSGPPSAARIIEGAFWMALTLIVTLLVVFVSLVSFRAPIIPLERRVDHRAHHPPIFVAQMPGYSVTSGSSSPLG